MNGKIHIDARLLEQINAATWVKSKRSSGGTNCVEVAFLPQLVCLRDSKNLDQRPLLFTTSAYDAFISGLEQRTVSGLVVDGHKAHGAVSWCSMKSSSKASLRSR